MKIVKLKLKKVNDDRYDFIFKSKTSNKVLGAAIKDVDGFFYFYFDYPTSGGWTGETLKAIAKKTIKLNKKWNKQIQKELNK